MAIVTVPLDPSQIGKGVPSATERKIECAPFYLGKGRCL